MAVIPLYKSRSMQFGAIAMKDGTLVPFVHGKAFTEDERIQAELSELARTKQAGVWIDPKEPTIDTSYLNPVDRIKQQAIEEYKNSAAFRALLNPNAAPVVEAGDTRVTSGAPLTGMQTSQHVASQHGTITVVKPPTSAIDKLRAAAKTTGGTVS